MGSVRGGLILTLIPSAAFAEVCDKMREDWDGQSVSAFEEALFLFSSWPALILILATLAALRFRSQWGGLLVCVGWSGLIYLVTFGSDRDGVLAQAQAEGCIGSPALFIGAVLAICTGTILYTLPRETRL